MAVDKAGEACPKPYNKPMTPTPALTARDIVWLATILVAAVATYYGAQAAVDAKISSVRQDVAVQEANQLNMTNNVNELKKDVSQLDDKINALLLRNGINPTQYEENP
jgi:hypothetical protein